MLGWQEIILILAILLLVFGPSKLPEIAKELGKAVREFRRASEGFSEAITAPDTTERESNQRKAVMDIAAKLGVSTEGKTLGQITQEIATKIENKEKDVVETVQNEVK